MDKEDVEAYRLCVCSSFSVIEKLQEIMTEVETAISTFKEDQHQRFAILIKLHT